MSELRAESALRNREHYQKYLSFLLRNPDRVNSIRAEFFLAPTFQTIYNVIKELFEGGHKVTLDEVFTFTKRTIPEFTYESLVALQNDYTDFSNIELIRRILQDEFLKVAANHSIMEDLLVAVNSAGTLDRGKFRSGLDELMKNITLVDNDSSLLDGEKLVQRHHHSLLGKKEDNYSVGFKSLDEKLGKPGVPKKMTLVFGPSGHGKTSFVLSLINNLITNPKIPVLYLSLEMSEEDVMDRLVSLKGDIPVTKLRKTGITKVDQKRIDFAWNQILNHENFLMEDCPGVSIKDIEAKIIETKEVFRAKGILPANGYIMVIIDLLTMCLDFNGFRPNEIQNCMDQFHFLVKRQGCHLMGVVQANENEIRKSPPKSIEDVQNFNLARNSIKGGAAMYERVRVVFSILRKKQMALEYFASDADLIDTWDDVMEVKCIKDNDGPGGFMVNYLFGENYRITKFSGTTWALAKSSI